jgi:hypothetical protein
MKTKFAILFLTYLLSLPSFAQYVTVDKDGNLITTTADGIRGAYGGSFSEDAFKQFDGYAKYTGGQMGFCPDFDHLPKVLDGVLQIIINGPEDNQDVVIALDTTGSMADEINAVKKNLITLVEKLAKNNQKDIEISIVLYKDQNQTDPYVAKLITDLESDLQVIQKELKQITVSGGGDHPEAVLDALELVESDVHFRLNSNKTVILIGDAPGHKSSKTTGLKTNEVLDLFVLPGQEISINPILVSAHGGGGFGGGFGSGGFGGFGTP